MIYKDYSDVENVVFDIDAINNSITNILTTQRGTVPGKPRFGSDLNTALFNQLDHITEGVIKTSIVNALNEFEPRILVNSVKIKSIPEYNKVVVDINYDYLDKGLIKSGDTSIQFNN